MDRYEVTNQEYKKFVDSGGYGKKEYWKNDFREVDTIVTLEHAIAAPSRHQGTNSLDLSSWANT